MGDTLLALAVTGLIFALYGVLKLLSMGVVYLRRSVRRRDESLGYWRYAE